MQTKREFDMDNVCRAETRFAERRNFLDRKRKRGTLPTAERPKNHVVVHTIIPAKRSRSKHKSTTLRSYDPSPPTVIKHPNADTTPSATRFMDTVAFAKTGGPVAHIQPYSVGERVAHANIKQLEYALQRLRQNLKQENSKSRCIGPLDAIIRSLQINLPNLLPDLTKTDGRS